MGDRRILRVMDVNGKKVGRVFGGNHAAFKVDGQAFLLTVTRNKVVADHVDVYFTSPAGKQ